MKEADMTTQERLLVDARGTWKPYRVAYQVIKALRGLEAGAVVEVITKDDQGLLNDLGIWCRATGHELLGAQPGQGRRGCSSPRASRCATAGR
jgi:TusA-related sulfurtransferase